MQHWNHPRFSLNLTSSNFTCLIRASNTTFILCFVNNSVGHPSKVNITFFCSWCHRILPIQATCILNEKEIKTTVSKLVLNYVDDKSSRSSTPLKVSILQIFSIDLLY